MTAIHRSVAQMYVEDPRFTTHYEQLTEGLATCVHDAIVASAAEAADSAD